MEGNYTQNRAGEKPAPALPNSKSARGPSYGRPEPRAVGGSGQKGVGSNHSGGTKDFRASRVSAHHPPAAFNFFEIFSMVMLRIFVGISCAASRAFCNASRASTLFPSIVNADAFICKIHARPLAPGLRARPRLQAAIASS